MSTIASRLPPGQSGARCCLFAEAHARQVMGAVPPRLCYYARVAAPDRASAQRVHCSLDIKRFSVPNPTLAVIADLHGNLPALEAVLADLQRVPPDRVVVAGDFVNRGPQGRAV